MMRRVKRTVAARVTDPVVGVARSAREYRSRTGDTAVAVQAVICGSLGAAFVAFLVGSQWTVFPAGVFLATTVVGWRREQAATGKAVTFLMTVGTVGVLALIVAFLLVRSVPAVEHMGVGLLGRTADPLWAARDGGVYSLAPMLVGTAITTCIATVIATPVGIAGAVFISEIAPPRVRDVVKPGIELMAGIPSITYGFIGLTVLNQYFYAEFRTPTIGSYLAAGAMIGVMALPTVVTISEDALAAVPESVKSGALAMGSTPWQTTKSVTLPAGLSGVSAGVLLGVGRAMGETMAATVMLTHTKGFPSPVFDVFSQYGETLTTVIAFEGERQRRPHECAVRRWRRVVRDRDGVERRVTVRRVADAPQARGET